MEPDDHLVNIYFLKSGYVRSYSLSEKGGEFTLNIYNPGSFFPITTILAGNKSAAFFFSTLTSCNFHVVPAKEVMIFLKNNPEVSFDLLQRISSGLEGVLERVRGIINASAKEKVASTLYLLGKKYGVKKGQNHICIEFAHTHETLSTLAGLTRETTSMQMKELENEAVIKRTNKKTCIINIASLKSNLPI